MRIGIEVDPLHTLEDDDTTLLIAREMLRRGYKVEAWSPNAIHHDGNCVIAKIAELSESHSGELATNDNYRETRIAEFDLVLLRANPPFTEHHLANTYLLETEEDNVVFVNSPQSLRNVSSKLSLLSFGSFAPPSIVCHDWRQATNFLTKYKKIVLKPLFAYGGKGIHFVSCVTKLKSKFSDLQGEFPGPVMAQKYLPEATLGDKRVFILNGEPGSAVLRIPAEKGGLANISQGAIPAKAEITSREREIIRNVAPVLAGKGVSFAGLDFIGGYLTEVNITSPGALHAACSVDGVAHEKWVVDQLTKMCEKNQYMSQ